MDSIEGKYSAKGHKGLQQRKSYNNILDSHDVEQEIIEGVAMLRSGSNQSTASTQPSVSSLNTDSTDASKESLLDEKMIIPGHPANFGVIVPGVYRSSYPKEADFDFIKSLKLKTIM